MDSNTKFILLVILFSFIVLINFKSLELFTNKEKIKVLLFYTKWCKQSQDFLIQWENTQKAFHNIEFIKYNLDEYPDKGEEYEISFIPTVYMLKGKKKIKFYGDANKGSLGNFIIMNMDYVS